MKQRGFSLIELMIVLAIVAILSAVAVPWYGQYVQRGLRADAISAMQGVMDAQERFYTDRITYTTNLTQLGLAPVSHLHQGILLLVEQDLHTLHISINTFFGATER